VSGPASERAKRYALELAELKDKVRVAQEQVTAFRQRTGVTDTNERNINVEQALLASLEGKLQDAQNVRRAAEVKAMSNRPRARPPTRPSCRSQGQLDTQQTSLAQLRTTYGSQHPKVLELENQIMRPSAISKPSCAASLGQFVRSRCGARARGKDAGRRRGTAQQGVGVNKLQDEGTKYELELESAQSVYKRALDGYDQIMFASGGHMPTSASSAPRSRPEGHEAEQAQAAHTRHARGIIHRPRGTPGL